MTSEPQGSICVEYHKRNMLIHFPPTPISLLVSLDSQEAVVVYQPHIITSEEIKIQIEAAGFTASIKKQPKPLQLGAIDVERLKNTQTKCSEKTLPDSPNHVYDLKAVMFRVDGMHCKSCVLNIQSSLSALPSVANTTVSLEEKSALVEFNPNLISIGALKRAIEAVSPETFKVSLLDRHDNSEFPHSPKSPVTPSARAINNTVHPLTQVTVIGIEGMTCASCVRSIEEVISQNPGVKSISVSLLDRNGTIEFDPMLISPDDLKNSIEDMGFDASLPGNTILNILH